MALDFSENGYEGLFQQALREGINLFCGAGFSLEATDITGTKLPTGEALLKELKEQFSSIKNFSNLPRACTKLTQTEKAKFYSFLKRRFVVKDFSELYHGIYNIKLNNIYTTNIDDLFFCLFENPEKVYRLEDKSRRGGSYRTTDKKPNVDYTDFIINYYPLHGCVRNSGDYVFGATEIASAFSNRNIQSSWKSLAEDASNHPILFWGWNFEDSGPIEAMYGGNNNISNNINRWVLLYNPSEETVDYLKTLQFNIIKGSTIDMLKYLQDFRTPESQEENLHIQSNVEGFLAELCPPKNDKSLPTYPMDMFFVDYMPHWSQIYTNRIPKLVHYKKIADYIALDKDVVIYGIRCSGKTTMLMQLMTDITISKKVRHYMIAPSLEQVELYLKALNGGKSLLFVDDGFRDTDAVIRLLKATNVQLVLADRDFDYERQYHRIQKYPFEPVDITEISPEDGQHIIDLLPEKLRRWNLSTDKFKKDSTLLTLLAENLKSVNFRFIQEFVKKDYDSARVFLLICYIHACGIPCSFDMIYSFLGDDKYTWQQMFEIVKRAGGLIKEYSEYFGNYNILDTLQDYYQCRSRFFAEKIIQSIPRGNSAFAEMLTTFVNNVPPYKICQYDKFKRNGYDADFTYRAFIDAADGERFYNYCLEKDDSEYIYQQAAIYFSRNKEFKKAFEWIDRANNMTHYNRFSIDSTYAQIYFDVNVETDKEQSKRALDILNDCCQNDQRKAIHFTAFAKRVSKFCDLYPQDSRPYIEQALFFIDEGLKNDGVSLSQKNKNFLRDIKNKLEKGRGII